MKALVFLLFDRHVVMKPIRIVKMIKLVSLIKIARITKLTSVIKSVKPVTAKPSRLNRLPRSVAKVVNQHITSNKLTVLIEKFGYATRFL